MAKNTTPYKWTNKATKIIALIIVAIMAISAIFVTLASGFQYSRDTEQAQQERIQQLQEQIQTQVDAQGGDVTITTEEVTDWPTFEKAEITDEAVSENNWGSEASNEVWENSEVLAEDSESEDDVTETESDQ